MRFEHGLFPIPPVLSQDPEGASKESAFKNHFDLLRSAHDDIVQEYDANGACELFRELTEKYGREILLFWGGYYREFLLAKAGRETQMTVGRTGEKTHKYRKEIPGGVFSGSEIAGAYSMFADSARHPELIIHLEISTAEDAVSTKDTCDISNLNGHFDPIKAAEFTCTRKEGQRYEIYVAKVMDGRVVYLSKETRTPAEEIRIGLRPSRAVHHKREMWFESIPGK